MTRSHRICVEAKHMKSDVVSAMTNEDRAEFKLNDNVSHFICRLAYCRNEELRKWFLTQETRLFNARLSEVQPATVKALLEAKCDIKYEGVKETDEDWK
jgi:DNA primase large subunit